MTMMKKMTVAAVSALMLITGTALAQSSGTQIDLSQSASIPASGTGWTYGGGFYTIQNGANVTVTGQSADERRIAIAQDANAHITLHDAKIAGLANDQAAILLNSGSHLTLTLTGESDLTGGWECAAIQTTGAQLTITAYSTGILNATSGLYGAGIGGGNYGDGGTITINGGTVNATSGLDGAGIGGGNIGAGGTITISGGTVNANGGIILLFGGGAGIGGGRGGPGGTITISGGTVNATGGDTSAGIGSGGASGGTITITISGGTVNATGKEGGAGIGAGYWGHGGSVTISGGTVYATALGIVHGSGIGTGRDIYTGALGPLGSFTLNGDDALVYASPDINANPQTLTRGILFIGNSGTAYGKVFLDEPFTIPSGSTFTVPAGAVLIVPSLTNNSTLVEDGKLIVLDSLSQPLPPTHPSTQPYIKVTEYVINNGTVYIKAQGIPGADYIVTGTPTFAPYNPVGFQKANGAGVVEFTFPQPDHSTYFFKVREK